MIYLTNIQIEKFIASKIKHSKLDLDRKVEAKKEAVREEHEGLRELVATEHGQGFWSLGEFSKFHLPIEFLFQFPSSETPRLCEPPNPKAQNPQIPFLCSALSSASSFWSLVWSTEPILTFPQMTTATLALRLPSANRQWETLISNLLYNFSR